MPRTISTFWKAMSTNWRRPRARTSRACRWCAAQYGIDFDEIEVFYLAGGFGRHLKVAASRRIGLIPDLPDERIVQVGNAAIEGACIALLSRSRRQELEELVARVEHCRLETHPSFFDFFVEGCQFKGWSRRTGCRDDGVERGPTQSGGSARPSINGCWAIRPGMSWTEGRSSWPIGLASGTPCTGVRGFMRARPEAWERKARR